MAQTPLTQKNGAGAHLVDEPSRHLSRKKVTVTGGDYPAGQVLGIITASKKYTAHDPAAADGSQVAAAILFDNTDATTDVEALANTALTAVNKNEITWKAGITAPQIATATAELNTKFIELV